MTGILLLAILVLGGLLFRLAGRVTALERTLDDLARPAYIPTQAEEPAPQPQPAAPLKTPARILRASAPPREPLPWSAPAPEEPEEQPEPATPAPAPTLESLIGGKLPIWIGGVALILSAFFLVRFSIESGLLGPGVRALLGAAFGLLLLIGSEAARRLPATADDPRIAQVLAGAGIASLYGTLYMAAQLYGLVGALPAFVLMITITVAALALSLRHGPPTAIMGLLGGFLAPFVTGIDPQSVAPLLVYLALFTTGLFALAIHRGWMWLALAATGGGLLWPLVLMGLAAPTELRLVGLFVIALAFAATLALPRAGAHNTRLRLAPLVIGLIQLVLLAPQLEFTPLAWGLYALLAAAALWLGARDPKLAPGAGAALCLMLLLLVIAYWDADPKNAPLAALGFTLMFGGAGHALARRHRIWTAIALGGTALPLVITYALATDLPPDWLRALLALAAAAACAALSWRFRDEAHAEPRFSLGLAGSAFVAALLAIIAFGQVADTIWLPAIVATAAAALAAWAGRTGDIWSTRVALIPLPLAAILPGLGGMMPALGASYAGETLVFPLLPPLTEILQQLALPGLILLAAFALARPAEALIRRIVLATVTIAIGLALYALAKQPLAIASPERFLALGFLERAAITQAIFLAGLLLLARLRLPAIGMALLALAALRFAWFDLALLNPLLVPQQVGTLPILNLAVLHPALAALWLRLAAPLMPDPRTTKALHIAALALIVVAAAAAVRQWSQGSLIDAADIGRTENYLYSAALLALSLGWLWRGLATGTRGIRLGGLALLTAVTLKVFLIDAAALEGILRILSFLALGLALIAIGWAYGKFTKARG